MFKKIVVNILFVIMLCCFVLEGISLADVPSVRLTAKELSVIAPGLVNAKTVTRERFFEIIGRAFKLKGKVTRKSKLTDLRKKSKAYPFVVTYYLKYGFTDNTLFYPKKNIKFNDAVAVINKFTEDKLLPESSDLLTGAQLYNFLLTDNEVPRPIVPPARETILLPTPSVIATASVIKKQTMPPTSNPDGMETHLDYLSRYVVSQNRPVLSSEYIEQKILEKKKQFEREKQKKIVNFDLSYQMTGSMEQSSTTISRTSTRASAYSVGIGMSNMFIPIDVNLSYSYDNYYDNAKQNLVGVMSNCSFFQEVTGLGNVMGLYTRSYTENYQGNLFLIGNFYYGLLMLQNLPFPSRIFIKASQMNSVDSNNRLSPTANTSMGIGIKQILGNFSISYELKSFKNIEGFSYGGTELGLGASFGLPFNVKMGPVITFTSIANKLEQKTIDFICPVSVEIIKSVNLNMEGEYLYDYYNDPNNREKKAKVSFSVSQTF